MHLVFEKKITEQMLSIINARIGTVCDHDDNVALLNRFKPLEDSSVQGLCNVFGQAISRVDVTHGGTLDVGDKTWMWHQNKGWVEWSNTWEDVKLVCAACQNSWIDTTRPAECPACGSQKVCVS